MTPLIHDDNREPIRRTAERINRTYESTLRLCRQGKLAHQRDATGAIWSSKAAADAFMGAVQGGDQSANNWPRRAAEVLQ